MDITILFKAYIKTIRTTNRSLESKEMKSNILKPIVKDKNLTKAKTIMQQIIELEKFLEKNKTAYLNIINYVSKNKTMTVMDCDQYDMVAEKIINDCTGLIKEYKKQMENCGLSVQQQEHYKNVIDSLDRYLKLTTKIYAETKATRVKRVLDAHKLSKRGMEQTYTRNESLVKSTTNQTDPIRKADSEHLGEKLSEEEMQMFESENETLFNQLNQLSDEVKQMESKVVHIAELQKLFSEKVLEQEQDVERIVTNVVGATSNVNDANEQIRQAIQRNAGMRVWVLFFLFVMSLSLLFLDWYND